MLILSTLYSIFLYTSIVISYEILLERTEHEQIFSSDKDFTYDHIVCKSNDKVDVENVCFYRNLFYNMDVSFMEGSIQETSKNYKLSIDLLSPYSWIKSDMCKICTLNEKKNRTQCSSDCSMGDFINTRACITKNGCFKTNRTGTLNFLEYQLKGKFVSDSFKINDELTIDGYNFLSVEEVINAPFFYSDGAIGMIKDNLTGSNFIGNLKMVNNHIKEDIFSIYIREREDNVLSSYRPKIIMGFIFEKYKDKAEFQYINVNRNSSIFWDLPIQSISLDRKSQNNERKVNFKNNHAFLTLDSTFIALPNKELNELVAILNKWFNNKCSLDENKLNALFCSDLKQESLLEDLKINFIFEEEKVVEVNPYMLLRDCKHENGKLDCFFNVHESLSSFTVLGEAFLKNFYSVFDYNHNKVC